MYIKKYIKKNGILNFLKKQSRNFFCCINIQQMTTKKVPFSSELFVCELCDYKSCRKSQYDRHILTAKHINRAKYNQNQEKSSDISNIVSNYNCDCGKSYPFRSSLYNHKKKFNFIINKKNNYNDLIEVEDKKEIIELKEDNKELKNMIKELIKENAKQQEQISELIPKIGNNNNNTNIQNNKFNIQVFLNEQCKDAINMSDFIKSLHITFEQLDFIKQKGIEDTLSKSIIDNINKLSIYERPLHCTDVKRETLYIKDEDNWSKDNSKEKIKSAIKKACSKNYNVLQDWKSENPDFMNNEEKTEYFTKSLSNLGKDLDKSNTRLIKMICNNTYLNDKDIPEE